MSKVVSQILAWLEKTLPNILAAFMAGFKLGEKGKHKVEAELDETKLKLKLKENELANEKKFSGLSDSDIILDAAKSGKSESESN